MNFAIVKQLIFKEWYFQRWMIAGYLTGGIVSLALLAGPSNGWFFAGTVLMLTVMIGVGVQLAISAGVNERTEQTLPFVMTLPLSPREYALAKLTANVAMYFTPWAVLTLATVALLRMSPAGREVAPLAAIVLTETLASFCLVLSVALVTESQGWTIGVMVASNLFLQGFLYSVSHMQGVARGARGGIAIWGPSGAALMASLVAVIVLLPGIAFALQSRKKNFI